MRFPFLSRRRFIGNAGILAAAGGLRADTAADARRLQALLIRNDAARLQSEFPMPEHHPNGDEQQYPTRIGNFSKGLPHNERGEVQPAAYEALLRATTGARWEDFEAIPLGCDYPPDQRLLVNPQAGLAFDLEGIDSHQLSIPPPPRLSSAEQAAEMVELYWQALARDIPFQEYDSSPLIRRADEDLNRLREFRGPRSGGRVTPATLFRGFTADDLKGPYLSQFLLKPIAYGPQVIDQRVRSAVAGLDYLTDYEFWLSIQNGWRPHNTDVYEGGSRYVQTGRDLASWVHKDVLFQAYFNACHVVLGPEGTPLSDSNPYLDSKNQTGFGTFGDPYVATAVSEVATRALKAVWYQKWFVHRRLRPEAYGGLVHHRLNGVNYPLHEDALNSQAVTEVRTKYGSYLLPQAYPEGAPLHPSYGSGHATVAGACVTMLKALFCETYVIPEPMVPSRDGLSLEPYTGPDRDALTLGGELNKLAANIAMARNFAGIHWRSDYAESLRLGEQVAIHLLMDHKATFGERFEGFTLTKFDGTRVTI